MRKRSHIMVYLAGPLFTQAERMWNLNLRAEVEKANARVKVILPQEEAANALDSEGNIDFAKLKDGCLDGIESADIVVAILDGADSDSGTCFECGYANAKGKVVIGVRTDIRAHEDEGLNAMLRETCHQVLQYSAFQDAPSDLSKLGGEISRSIISLATDQGSS